MEKWGNGRANEYYEAKIPRDYNRPKENDPVRTVERFIRDKYELKKFVAPSLPPPKAAVKEEEEMPKPKGNKAANGNSIPFKATSTSAVHSSPAPPAPVAQKAPPVPEMNLIDFMDSPVASTPTAAPTQQQQAFQQQQQQQQQAFQQQQQQQQQAFQQQQHQQQQAYQQQQQQQIAPAQQQPFQQHQLTPGSAPQGFADFGPPPTYGGFNPAQVN